MQARPKWVAAEQHEQADMADNDRTAPRLNEKTKSKTSFKKAV